MTQVTCRQRECVNWDEGACTAVEILVSRSGVCLTQDEDAAAIIDAMSEDRKRPQERRMESLVDEGDDEDEDWEDDGWPADDEEDEDDEDEDWDDEWDEDEPTRERE